VLAAAWGRVRAQPGAAGVEGVSLHQMETGPASVTGFLDERQEARRAQTYRPQAVRRVWIPKPNGKPRPWGRATGRDRVGQRATLLILEPVWGLTSWTAARGCARRARPTTLWPKDAVIFRPARRPAMRRTGTVTGTRFRRISSGLVWASGGQSVG
jgi:hypothetical protein